MQVSYGSELSFQQTKQYEISSSRSASETKTPGMVAIIPSFSLSSKLFEL